MTADVRPDGDNFAESLHYRKIPAGAVFKLSVTPSSAADGTEVSGWVDFLIMDEPA